MEGRQLLVEQVCHCVRVRLQQSLVDISEGLSREIERGGRSLDSDIKRKRVSELAGKDQCGIQNVYSLWQQMRLSCQRS